MIPTRDTNRPPCSKSTNHLSQKYNLVVWKTRLAALVECLPSLAKDILGSDAPLNSNGINLEGLAKGY